jgi:hypothetical protein
MGLQRSPSAVVLGPWPIERRVHKRFISSGITIIFLGADHPAINWSKGGILIADTHPDLPIGTRVSCLLSIRGRAGFFRSSAVLVRRDAQAGQLAFRFENLSPAVLEALSRHAELAANEPPSDLDGRQ